MPLTITGTNLLDTSVTRPGVTVQNVTVTPTEITAEAIITAAAPQVGVFTVTNQVATATVAFAVGLGAPALTEFSPATGQPGDIVTLAGAGFDEVTPANNEVRFAGVLAELVAATPTELRVRVPAGAVSGRITVTTPVGTATSATDFTVGAPPGPTLVVGVERPFVFIDDLVVAPDASRVYVVDEGRAAVSVVDAATHTVVASLPAGPIPFEAALSPDGTRLYVLSFDATVVALDLPTGTEVGRLTLPQSVANLALTPDGATLIVSHPNEGQVSLLDTASLTVAATLTVGGRPDLLSVAPDGSRVHVVQADAVTVVDPVARTVVATVPLGATTRAGVFHPSRTRAYQSAGDAVVVLDASSAVTATIPGVGFPVALAISPDGTRVYAAAESNATAGGAALVVIDTTTDTVLATLPLAGFPTGLAVTPDGARVVVAHQDQFI